MRKVMITAHSGCENTAMDSLNSVCSGIASGADCVEVDVRQDRFGVLVLSHDKHEVYSKAVTLEEAMNRVVDSDLCINCDLKEPSALYPVLELADEYGMCPDRLILSGSVSPDLLAADAIIAKRARIYLNVEEILKYLIAGEAQDFCNLMSSPWDFIKPRYNMLLDTYSEAVASIAHKLGAETVNLPYKSMTSQRFAMFRKCGMPLSLWTVNDAADISRLLAEHPLNITTLQAKTALSLRNNSPAI